MPSLTQPDIQVEPGARLPAAGLQTLAQVQQDNGDPDNRAFAYDLRPIDGSRLNLYTRTANADGMQISAMVWNAPDRTIMWGAVPDAGGIWSFRYTATLDDETYTTQFSIISRPNLAIELARLENILRTDGPYFAPEAIWRHDTLRNRVLLMSLPSYAPAGSGVKLGASPDSPQYLPIENITEFQPPSVESDIRPLEITIGQKSGDFLTQASYQTVLKIGRAGARIGWHEDYISHGGPYGLRVAAFGKIPPPHWIYYQKAEVPPEGAVGPFPIGKILVDWVGFVSEYHERGSQNSIFVDIVITPETSIFLPNPIPRADDVTWTAPATSRNAPTLIWP